LGNYKIGADFLTFYDRFEKEVLKKVASSDHNIILDLDMDAGSTKYERSRAIIDPYITQRVTEFLNTVRDEKMITELETNRNTLIELIDGLNFIMETNGKDAKIDKETTTVVTLTDFNNQKFYSQYDEAINLIKDKHAMFTSELDTSIDFIYPSFNNTLYSKLLAFIIKDDISKIIKEYENSPDNKLFDNNAINKIERRLKRFIKNATDVDEKKFKYKKVQNKKDFKPYAFTIGGTLSGPQQSKLAMIHGSKDNSTASKLNFSKVIK
jgi:hypothetical protein